MEYKIGDKVICIFNTILPGNTVGPDLELNKAYEVYNIAVDKEGNQHLDLRLETDVETVRSYATKELLPSGAHWCHPQRFIPAK